MPQSGKRVIVDLGQVRLESDSHGLVCPWPSQIHPSTEDAAARTLLWLDEYAMLDANPRLRTERYTWLVGRMFPNADDAVFQLLSDFTSWIFDHDDVVDESRLSANPEAMAERFDRERLLFQGRVAPTRPSEHALCDVGRRFEEVGLDSIWFSRFVLNFCSYLDGCLWEGGNRAYDRTPRLDEYVSLRPFAAAAWLYMEVVELVLGRRLPFDVREHRQIQALRCMAADLVAWHNDVYSVVKELRVGDAHNLVIVLQHEKELELHDAVRQVVRRSNERVRAFDEIVASLNEPGAETYIDALRWFVRGAFDYLLESSRYVTFGAEPAPED